MISNCFSTVSGAFVVLLVLAALAAPATAAEPTAAVSHGIAPTGEREFGAKVLVCAICHGARGAPQNPAIPVIWGQQENYLLKQLHDFQSGDRAFEAMAWMATAFSQEEQKSAAAYFAKKAWPTRAAAAGAAAAAASPPPTVAVCQACHQQNLVGGVAAPRLAGQSYEYLVESMRRFADGERTNNPDMTRLMQAIAPAERDAMAHYIAGL
jgi:cytochrome c553